MILLLLIVEVKMDYRLMADAVFVLHIHVNMANM